MSNERPRTDAKRLEAIRAELEARLRASCTDMEPVEFVAMIARMADIQFRFEVRSSGGHPHVP
ncbi:MAG: hypothetical protein JWL95_2070 [Gemmatimonadetes bacterium]|nr:hypothetical protein [Gemmatimonadota bacterium]